MSDDLIARVVDVLIMSPMSEHVHEFEHVGHTADALMSLIREVQSDEARDHQTAAEDERDALAARLAAVEALLPFWEGCDRPQADGSILATQIRAVLSAAPTDTTKEADR